MNNNWQKTALVTVLSVLLVGIIVSGCASTPSPSYTTLQTTKTHLYIDSKVVIGGDGQPIELINNPDATNPTYAGLLTFIERNQIDKYSYILGPPKNAYICTDFARDVHNNAEAARIRAAWVGTDIEGETAGHALNAFETTDLGLVYIDCTGKGLWDESPNRRSWDRRARVEIGQPYAVADIYKAKTRLVFLIYTPKYCGEQFLNKVDKPEEQTLRRLQELEWIRIESQDKKADSEKRIQRKVDLSEWSRTHDIEELGLNWMQEWIQEHEVLLYGRDFEIKAYSGGNVVSHLTSKGQVTYVKQQGWYILVDCLDTSWFQPVEKIIYIDGIPLVWKIRWEMRSDLWFKPFGNKVIKDIHIRWGE